MSNVVGRPGKGTEHRDLESWSAITMITVFPLDSGRSVKKLIVPGMLWSGQRQEFSGREGVGNLELGMCYA